MLRKEVTALKERNTYQKTLIKNKVLNMDTHPSADAIYEKVKEEYPNVSKATVYRVLNDLADKGEVYRVKVTDGPDRFDKTLCGHYHVRCTECGKVSDIPVAYFTDIEKQADCGSDYKITGHVVAFEGICPDCLCNNK